MIGGSDSDSDEVVFVLSDDDASGDDDDIETQNNGATHEDVSRLPTQVIAAEDVTRAEGLDESLRACSICLEPWAEGAEVTTLPCLHRYHSECIKEWLARNASCPVCKHAVGGGEGESDAAGHSDSDR